MDPKKNLQRVSQLLLKGILPLPGSLKKKNVLQGRYRQVFIFSNLSYFTPNHYNKKKNNIEITSLQYLTYI